MLMVQNDLILHKLFLKNIHISELFQEHEMVLIHILGKEVLMKMAKQLVKHLYIAVMLMTETEHIV